jgi:hypothetical protein
MSCQHDNLQFNSGDYYLTCVLCGARWGRINNLKQPEYGLDKDGKPVGCTPEEANNGWYDQNQIRQKRYDL